MTLIKRKQCVLLCETKAKTSCAVTMDIFSHDAAHVTSIYATKALDSVLCMCVLILVSHEIAMVTRHSDKWNLKPFTMGLSDIRHPGHP